MEPGFSQKVKDVVLKSVDRQAEADWETPPRDNDETVQ